MDHHHIHDLIIIGAGPIGLESALYAAELKLDFLILEADRPAATLQQWGFVKMFSSFELNSSPLGRKALGLSSDTSYPTGRRMKEQYFDRLAELPAIKPRLKTGVTVERISRWDLLKADMLGRRDRADHPFLLLARERKGTETTYRARRVIDASGVFNNPNYLGPGGLPAVGERALADRISYHLREITPDALGDLGRDFLVVGGGHSACTMVSLIDDAAQSGLDVRATWVTSHSDALPVRRIDDDPLPERARVVERANRIAGAGDHVRHLGDHWVESITPGDGDHRLAVTLRGAGEERATVEVDHVFGMVGYRPDRTMYEELQVHECYASAAPMKLAAAMLGQDSGGDCLAPVDLDDDVYDNPEPNFYILGSKSYGRSTDFLIGKGHDQIRSVFRKIAKQPDLDLYGAR